MVLSPLAIRIPVINPEPLLRWLSPVADVLFARFTVWTVVVLGLVVNLCAFARWMAIPMR